MNARRTIFAGLLALAAGLSAPVAVADYAAGKTAYEGGDYAGALAEWTKSGGQGDGLSLFGLGRLYQGGQGVRADPVKAHAYYNIASALGVGQGAPARDSLAELMSPEDVAAAQDLANDLMSSRQFVEGVAPAPAASTPAPAQPAQAPVAQPAAPAAPAPPAAPAAAIPRLALAKTCEHVLTWSDGGSGGDSDISLYDPKPDSGQYVVGGYPQRDYNAARGCVATVAEAAGAAGAAPALAPPASWRVVWEDAGSGARMDGSIWQAVPPSQDYVCIGHLGQTGYSPPSPPPYACVHRCLVTQVAVGPPVWTDRGTGARTPVAIYQLPNSGVFHAVAGGGAASALLDLDPSGAACGG